MNYFYLHGFLSGPNPNSGKVHALSKVGKVYSLIYDSQASRTEILSTLNDQVNDLVVNHSIGLDFVFVGTSLGAYYSSMLGQQHRTLSILINPAIAPFKSLADAVGKPLKNYKTGQSKIMTADALESYKSHPMNNEAISFDVTPLVLLDLGDKLFNSQRSKQYFREFLVHSFPGGSHQFEHMPEALDIIVKTMRNMDDISDIKGSTHAQKSSS